MKSPLLIVMLDQRYESQRVWHRHGKWWRAGRESTDLEPEEVLSAAVAATGGGR